MNKYAFFAILWFIAGVYVLIFRESSGELPPFPQFDKLCHFALFFLQIWLCAKAFLQSNRTVPKLALILFALLYALGSELGQATLTETREGSWLDGLADMVGALTALWWANFQQEKKVKSNK